MTMTEEKMRKMSDAALDKAIDKQIAVVSVLTKQAIGNGWSHLRSSDIYKLDDPLARIMKSEGETMEQLYCHRDMRNRLGSKFVRRMGGSNKGR